MVEPFESPKGDPHAYGVSMDSTVSNRSNSSEKSLAAFVKEEVVPLTIELVLELVFKIGHNPSTLTPGGAGSPAEVVGDPAS